MNILNIVYAGGILGVLGIVFGAVLVFAEKKFHVEADPRVEAVRACLAGANCGACGFSGCDGYAMAVVEGTAPMNACAPGGPKAAAAIAAESKQIEARRSTVETERTAAEVRYRNIIDNVYTAL